MQTVSSDPDDGMDWARRDAATWECRDYYQPVAGQWQRCHEFLTNCVGATPGTIPGHIWITASCPNGHEHTYVTAR